MPDTENEELIAQASRIAGHQAVERLRAEAEGKSIREKVTIPVNTARLVLHEIDQANATLTEVINWGADDEGNMPDGLAAALASRPPVPVDGVWTCGHCGHGSEAHGMPTHAAYRCVYEPVWNPVAPPVPVTPAPLWQEPGHGECDCVPNLSPSHCHLCGKAAGYPVKWEEAPCRAVTPAPTPRAPVITLCGSTKFKDEFISENTRLTMEGNVVISLGLFGHTDLPDYDWTTDATDLKRTLDRLHFQKIDMADRVHVVNPTGYFGESTAREIAYAESLGKPVTYMVAPETGEQ